jgi:2-polyprenyl-3-methyl-5-hydroxy-6-metoxy-1,4-benzoquinol methylase
LSASAPRAHPGSLWDALSDYFGTTGNQEEIPAGAADNILIAWPAIFWCIDAAQPGLPGRRALDFGCGTGSFAHALHARGFRLTGIDSSAAMIARARAAYGVEVEFSVGDGSTLADCPTYALITSVMALQFVPEIATLLTCFAAALEAGGRLVFAVHNPDFFRGDVLHFQGGIEVPIFIRTADDYHTLARTAGLTPVFEEKPPFTEAFLERYPGYAGGNAPAYLVLGYDKP